MPVQNLRIGWVGFHQEGIRALRGLLESGIRLEGVVTLEGAALAKRSAAAGYAGLLAPYGVPLHEISSINDVSSVSLLRSMQLDLLFVIGWSQILSSEGSAVDRTAGRDRSPCASVSTQSRQCADQLGSE